MVTAVIVVAVGVLGASSGAIAASGVQTRPGTERLAAAPPHCRSRCANDSGGEASPLFVGRTDRMPPALQSPPAGRQTPLPPAGNPPPQPTGLPPRDRSGRPPGPPVDGTASITGRVVDAQTGRPLRRVSVRAWLTSAPNPRSTRSHVTRTDDQGAYLIEQLPAGTYTLVAERAGYVAEAPSAGTSGQRAQRVSVDEGQRLTRMDFRLVRGGVIAGRVLDDAGEPAEAVMLRVLRAQRVGGRERFVPGGGRSVMSDDLGNFRVFGLPAGEYLLAAEPGGARMSGRNTVVQGDRTDVVTTYAPGTPSPADALRIAVTPGEVASVDLQLVASRVVTVSGRVVDSTGRPLGSGMVQLRADGASVMGGVARGTLVNGTFTITGVVPGPYVLIVRARAPGPTAGSSETPQLESARLPVAVGTEDLANLAVSTQPPSTASGRFVIEGDASKLAQTPLRVFGRPTDPEASMFGAAMGPGQARVPGESLTVTGLSGESVLTVSGLPRGWWVKAVRVNGRDALDGFDFGTGRRWTGVEIVLNDRPASIGGQVVGTRGEPSADATVLVFPTDFAERATIAIGGPGLVGVGMPDQNGTFAVESLRPGDYYVIALPAGEADRSVLQDPERLQSLAERAERVTLREGDMHFVTVKVGQ